jgi:hypothetical protein
VNGISKYWTGVESKGGQFARSGSVNGTGRGWTGVEETVDSLPDEGL